MAKLVIMKFLRAIIAFKGWVFHQLDVNNVFLRGDRGEETYMGIRPGFSHQARCCFCKQINFSMAVNKPHETNLPNFPEPYYLQASHNRSTILC